MTWIGLVLTGGAIVVYLGMLGVHRFTYRSWIFHIPVGIGVLLSFVGLTVGGPTWPAVLTWVLAAFWVWLMTYEMGVRGSEEQLRVGETIPPFEVVTTTGASFTDKDLAENAPALLQLYRVWWCPTSNLQLQEILDIHEQLDELGVTTFAASVDSPEEAAPLQEKLGSAITLLCNVENTMLDALGVEDRRGAAWYSRLTPGVKKRPIAMPSAIAIDPTGRIVHSFRTDRVDERAKPDEIVSAIANHAYS